jgi:hypothetical protein
MVDRAASATPPTPYDPEQDGTDKDGKQDRPGSPGVTTSVDRGPRQRLAVGLHDLLGTGWCKQPNPLRLPASARREGRSPRAK